MSGLTNLEYLIPDRTTVTDIGLVTDKGVAELQQAMPECEIID